MIFDKILGKKTAMPLPENALPGRETPTFEISGHHIVLDSKMTPPFPEGLEVATFGLGCFWGAERVFWQTDGVWTTAAGYAGGFTPNPTYEEVCSGQTGHTEVVLVVFDPKKVTFEALTKLFFEAHDPTQGMRQGGDVGTQYRSAIYYHNDEQRELAEAALASYDQSLRRAGHEPITTEITEAGPFYYAEEYHQQYLEKNPGGYCGIGGTGITCAMPRRRETEPAPAAVSGGDHTTADDPGLKPLPKSEEEWRQILGPEQYQVLRQAGTERPFTGHYNAVWEEGTYRCGACGNPLFDSSTKYEHNCGWPSFGEALPDAVTYHEDTSIGRVRTEVRCARCDSHLGHVFNDGPAEFDGARYCMNSIAIDLDDR